MSMVCLCCLLTYWPPALPVTPSYVFPMLTQTPDTRVDSVASSSPGPGVPSCPSSAFLIKTCASCVSQKSRCEKLIQPFLFQF